MPDPTNIIRLDQLASNPDGMADKLKAAFAQQNDPNASRIVLANAQGKILPPAPTEPVKQELILTPFKDGVLFKAMPNPQKPGTYIITDGAGVAVALARDGEIADIICKGVDVFYRTVQEQATLAKAEADAGKAASAGEETK